MGKGERQMSKQEAHVGIVTKVTRYKKGKVDKTFFRFVHKFGGGIASFEKETLEELAEVLKKVESMIGMYQTIDPGQPKVNTSEDILIPVSEKQSDFEEALSKEQMRTLAILISI